MISMTKQLLSEALWLFRGPRRSSFTKHSNDLDILTISLKVSQMISKSASIIEA